MSAISQPTPDSVAYRRGVFLVLLCGVFWSTVGLVVRLMEAAGGWQILFYRSASLALFLFAVVAWRGGGRPLRAFRQAGLSGVLGGLGLVLAFTGSIFSILNTTVANAMFLFATAPFIAAVLGLVLLKETVRRATWLAIGVGTVGVAVMVADGIGGGRLAGNLWGIGSAVGFALFTVALRWGRNEDMLPAVCLGGAFTTVIAAVMCAVDGQTLAIGAHDAGLAVFLGVFQLGAGLTIFTIGSRAVPAAELALLAMTEVMLGPVWVWVFLGESASLWTLAGGAVLLAAIAGNALSGLRRRPPPMAV